MARRFILFSLLTILFAAPACVKRIPASAGSDRKVVAGHEVVLGEDVEVPEGATVAWVMGDGATLSGPQVRHAWQRPGRFQVSVTVTDPDGEQRQDSAFVEVTRPELLDVIPPESGSLVLFDHPGERLRDVPLLLERLMASGQDANSILAGIREQAGFDPFRPEGWRAAGLDPTGGLALVGDDQGENLLVVASLLPGDAAHEALRALLFKTGSAKEQPSQQDVAITEVRSVDSGDLIAAHMDFRGHLWVAVPEDGKQDPVERLVGLRKAGLQPGLGTHPAFVKARQTREELGAMHLYVSGERARSQVPAGAAGGAPVERGIRDSLREEMTFLRGDLSVAPNAVGFELFVGLAGERIAGFAKVLKARNPVPDFRTLLAPGRHVVLKASADWFGLAQALGQLGQDAEMWRKLPQVMDEASKRTGVDVRRDLIENLGDSWMLAIRLKVAGLLGLAGERKERSLSDLLDGVVFLQLRDADRFFAALDQIGKQGSALAGLVADHAQGQRRWKVGSDELGLVLTPAKDMAVLATSAESAEAARALVADPRAPAKDWPQAIGDPSHQVLAVDLGQLIEDFERTPGPPGDASAAVAKGMIAMGLAKVGKLDSLLLDAVFEDGGLRASIRLSVE